MLLHLISKSPLRHSALNDALPFISNSDTVILIDDGVYACLEKTSAYTQLTEKNCTLLALENDIKVRGLTSLNTNIKTISMNEFVKITFTANKTLSWY